MSELIGGWVAGLTATLIREGINKHRAREIAQGYWEAYCKDDLEAEIAQLRRDHETEAQRLTQERDALLSALRAIRSVAEQYDSAEWNVVNDCARIAIDEAIRARGNNEPT